MPLPSRTVAPVLAAAPVPDPAAQRDRALEVLLSAELAPAVALVCWRAGDEVHVADACGRTAVRADGSRRLLTGRDPLADDDPYGSGDRCYPFAAERLHGLFVADDRAPDLAVVATGALDWTDRGGARGEHGSLNAVQSRAPLLLSGSGVTARGVVDGVARTVDVAATLAALTGASYDGMDGRPVPQAGPGARHVVGLLWDGAPCDDLLALAADGTLPAVARLLERGCALRGGAVAEFPSVTLANHTSALTGLSPGRHGIVHNAFADRRTGQRHVPNSPDTWAHAMTLLRPGVRTVWERLAEADPTAVTACVDEPCDRGAAYSTFALVRASSGGAAGSLVGGLPPAEDDPHTSRSTWRSTTTAGPARSTRSDSSRCSACGARASRLG